MTEADETPHERGRRRQRHAAVAGGFAALLLIVGFVLSRASGDMHDYGVLAFGYGLGVALAATLLTLGWKPRPRT